MNPMSIEASTVSGAAAANGLINEESSEPQHASDDVTLNSSSTSSTFSRLQLRRRKRHPPSDKRISFRDRPDLLKSRYFFYTFLYALFYLVGAGWGYSKKGNLFCLIISGFLGLMLLVFSLVHAYDYYNGAPLESMYVSVPFSKSLLLLSPLHTLL